MFYKKKCEQNAFILIVVLVLCVHTSATPPFYGLIANMRLFIIRTMPEDWVPAHSIVKQTKKAVTAVVYAIIAFDYV
jgi:hypothetical protein